MKFKFPFLMTVAGAGEAGGGAAPAPVTPPAAPAPIDNTSIFTEGWHARLLSDEVANSGRDFTKYQNLDTVFKELDYFQKKQPAYPTAQSADQDIAAFRALAQVPDKADLAAYGINLGDDANPADAAAFQRIADKYHAAHGSAPAFQAAIAEFQAIQAEEIAEATRLQAAALAEAKGELIKEWGSQYEAHSSTVRHFTAKLADMAGIPESSPDIAAMANNPAFARIMLEVSKLTSEDGTRTPAGVGDMRSQRQQADAIMAGTDPIWSARYKEGDRAAYNHVAKLLQAAAS